MLRERAEGQNQVGECAPGCVCRRYALGLAAAAGLAVIGVVAIAMSGDKNESVALAVSPSRPHLPLVDVADLVAPYLAHNRAVRAAPAAGSAQAGSPGRHQQQRGAL